MPEAATQPEPKTKAHDATQDQKIPSFEEVQTEIAGKTKKSTTPGEGEEGEEEREDDSSIWNILSDMVDTVMGVKGRPDKLLRITNGVLLCLLWTVILTYVISPKAVSPAPEDALSLKSMRLSLLPRDVIYNANVIAKNPQTIPYLICGFLLLLALLAGLINYVTGMAIKNARKEDSKKTD